jgi:hypothetical protein
MPDSPSFTRRFITFSDTTGVKPDVTMDNAANPQTVSLDAGSWNVTADGYVGSPPDYYKAASGSGAVTISNGVSTGTTISLEALPIEAEADPGVFAWNIDTAGINAGLSEALIILQPLPSGSAISIDLRGEGYYGFLANIPAGSYEVLVRLSRDGKIAGINPVAYIYPRLTTTAAYTFTDEYFVSVVMLAGRVSVEKPAGLDLTGDITVSAYRDAERTTKIGSAAIGLPAGYSGGTHGLSGEWIMAVPVSGDLGLSADKRVWFTVSAGDISNHTYTAAAGDAGPIPDKGIEGLNLPLSLFGITVTSPAHGTLATSPPGLSAGVAGQTIALTVSVDTGYTMMGGRPKVYKTGDTAASVQVDGTAASYSFVMPAHEVTVEALLKSAAAEIAQFYFTIGGLKYGIGTGTENDSGSINGSDITITLPYGTDVSSLSPYIAVASGAAVSPASGDQQDFTGPVTYTVTAEDEITEAAYEVSVNYGPGISISGITDAELQAITFTSNATPSLQPGQQIIVMVDSEQVTDWYVYFDSVPENSYAATGPTLYLSAPAAPGFYTVNVLAEIGGILYSGFFSLIVDAE